MMHLLLWDWVALPIICHNTTDPSWYITEGFYPFCILPKHLDRWESTCSSWTTLSIKSHNSVGFLNVGWSKKVTFPIGVVIKKKKKTFLFKVFLIFPNWKSCFHVPCWNFQFQDKNLAERTFSHLLINTILKNHLYWSGFYVWKILVLKKNSLSNIQSTFAVL